MKKFLLLIAAVAVTLSVSAAKPTHTLGKPVTKAPAKVDIITEQPEGEVVSYARGGYFLTVSIYGFEATAQTGQTKESYAPDGKTG